MEMEEEEEARTPKLVIDEGIKMSTDSPDRPSTSRNDPMDVPSDQGPLGINTTVEPMSETGSTAFATGGEPSPSSTSSFELHEDNSEPGSTIDSKEELPEEKDEKPTTSMKPGNVPEKESLKFDWKTYMAETESDPAPRANFFQVMGPIENLLKEDMKIECQDPRGPSGKFCLTNVEAVHGVFACVRLMGCDSSNDRWLLCNDRNIQYIGYSLDSGKGDLEPPVGYMYNMAKFRAFLDAQLKDGEPATREEIDSISLDSQPKKNLFEVGQKLEAVDPQNFMGTIHPATVIEVDPKTVKVAFDGWPKGYDMVCPFDSRYIFPIGWAESVGMKLEHPPKQKTKRKIEIVKADAKADKETTPPVKKKKRTTHLSALKSKSKEKRSISTTPKGTSSKKSEMKKSNSKPKAVDKKKLEPIKKEPKSPEQTPEPSPASKRSRNKRVKAETEREREGSEDKSSPVVKLSQSTLDQLLIPVTDFASKSRVSKSTLKSPVPTSKVESRVPTIFEKLKATVAFQSSRSSTPEDPPKPVGETSTGSGVEKPTQKVRGPVARKSLGPPSKPGSSTAASLKPKKVPGNQEAEVTKPTLIPEQITVHVKAECSGGPLLDVSLLRAYEPLIFGPNPADIVMVETLQHLVNCSKPPLRDTVLNAIPKGSSSQFVSGDVNGRVRLVNVVELKSHSQAWGLLKDFLSRIGACRNLLGPNSDLIPCAKCSKSGSKPGVPTSGTPLPSSSWTGTTEASPGKERPKNPEHWSVEDVAQFVADLEETELPDLFRQSSIDGRAMFLLTPDLCMRYMHLRLGPALKVCAKIDTLKAAHAGKSS